MGPPSDPSIDDLILQSLQREHAGDIAGALRVAKEAVEIATNGNFPLDRARALASVARYRFRLGQYESARQLAQEVYAFTDPSQDPHKTLHAEALLLLGMCASETNSLTICEDYYRRAADLARETGNKLQMQRALHNLASAVYLMRGQFDLAIRFDTQALQICLENQWSEWAMSPLITLGIAFQASGQSLRAHDTISDLLRCSQPGSIGEGYAGYLTGALALDEGDLEEAGKQFARAQTIAEALGDPSLNLDLRLGFSRMFRLGNDGANACAWAEDASRFADRIGYRIYQGRARMERARALWLNEDLRLAEDNLRQALQIFIEMELHADFAEATFLLAMLSKQQKDPDAAQLFVQASKAILAGGYEFLLERELVLAYPLVAAYLDHSLPEAARLMEEIQCVPPRSLRVKTLGGLAVWIGTRRMEPKALRQRRAGEFLVLLLASPRYSLSSQQVTEAMCPEKDPQAALDFYHHGISALRRLLEPDLPDRRFACRYLEASDERITLLLPPGSWVDTQQFETCIQNKDWEGAGALYMGDYLPEFYYSEWTIPLRQQYANHAEQALLYLAEKYFAAGDHSTCLSQVDKVLRLNSWQEQAVELGMRAALQLGNRTAALKMYNHLVKVLAQELGIAPQKELQALYETIKTHPHQGKLQS
jgi:DNA-binding SARP family transcriptional activator